MKAGSNSNLFLLDFLLDLLLFGLFLLFKLGMSFLPVFFDLFLDLLPRQFFVRFFFGDRLGPFSHRLFLLLTLGFRHFLR